MGLKTIGYDEDRITQISIDALYSLKEKTLTRILIKSDSQHYGQNFHFIFDDNTEYIASGFSIGYGGEGPKGFWKVIKLFWPEWPFTAFEYSPIGSLSIDQSHVFTKDGVLLSEIYKKNKLDSYTYFEDNILKTHNL